MKPLALDIDIPNQRVMLPSLSVNLKAVMTAVVKAVPDELKVRRLRFKLVHMNTVVGEIRLKSFESKV